MTAAGNHQLFTSDKLRGYFKLTKFRLSATVVFSGLFGFVLAADSLKWLDLVLFGLAAFLTTATANIINQVHEQKLDAMMERTKDRPLATGLLSTREAVYFALLCFVVASVLLLTVFNIKAMILAWLSTILYGFVYTPMKRVGPIAVAIGALPGAFPPMIGWVAATGAFGLEPGILFAIQFFWQFPHFWAIAWVLHDDYSKAGFKLLPSTGGRNINSAISMMIYTLFLLPICWLPYYLKMTGITSAFVATVFGVLFLAQTFHLMRKVNRKAALQLMFGSFIFLPVVQIAYLLDKV